jgi:alpha-1,6-mannosyltransferase
MFSVLMAVQYWMQQKHNHFFSFSAAAIIIFRAELSLFLGLLLLYDLFTKRITLLR